MYDCVHEVLLSYLIIVIFRWKGENVSSTEVANVMSQPDFVLDANVYGVKIPGRSASCHSKQLQTVVSGCIKHGGVSCDVSLLETSCDHDISLLETSCDRDMSLLETSCDHDMSLLETSFDHDISLLETSCDHYMSLLETSCDQDISLLEKSCDHFMSLLETSFDHDMSLLETSFH